MAQLQGQVSLPTYKFHQYPLPRRWSFVSHRAHLKTQRCRHCLKWNPQPTRNERRDRLGFRHFVFWFFFFKLWFLGRNEGNLRTLIFFFFWHDICTKRWLSTTTDLCLDHSGVVAKVYFTWKHRQMLRLEVGSQVLWPGASGTSEQRVTPAHLPLSTLTSLHLMGSSLLSQHHTELFMETVALHSPNETVTRIISVLCLEKLRCKEVTWPR